MQLLTRLAWILQKKLFSSTVPKLLSHSKSKLMVCPPANRTNPCLALGRGCRGHQSSAGSGPGCLPGGQEGEAAAGRARRRWWRQQQRKGQTPVCWLGCRSQICQGPGTTGSTAGAAGPIQPGKRQDQLEEEEESQGSGEEEAERASGGGLHPNAVRRWKRGGSLACRTEEFCPGASWRNTSCQAIYRILFIFRCFQNGEASYRVNYHQIQ